MIQNPAFVHFGSCEYPIENSRKGSGVRQLRGAVRQTHFRIITGHADAFRRKRRSLCAAASLMMAAAWRRAFLSLCRHICTMSDYVVRPLAALYPIAQKVKCHNAGQADSHPKTGKGQADLAPEVERQMGVIPHPQPQPHIQDQP